MKYIIIKKTGRVSNDFSCENIIRFTANLNRYADRNIVSDANFIFARIPDKKGDMAGAERFFENVDMYVPDPPRCKSFDEMKVILDKAFEYKTDIGHSLILTAVKNLIPDDGYSIIDL